jgi:hypothetical protein
MRVPRPASDLLTSVSAIGLRPWAHLPQRPGIKAPLANPRGLFDPSASWAGLAVHRCPATSPDRYRSGLRANVTTLKEVGLETKFHQPDFFYGASLKSRRRPYQQSQSRRLYQPPLTRQAVLVGRPRQGVQTICELENIRPRIRVLLSEDPHMVFFALGGAT